MKIPDRWLTYSNSGRIKGTRFVAFKVILNESKFRSVPPDKKFTSVEFINTYPGLKLIIDLTNTNKYYHKTEEFESKGIRHKKLRCKGREIPEKSLQKRFKNIVNKFIQENPEPEDLIGVHCTHGVNRTGYLICLYMIEEMGFSFKEALERFRLGRTIGIERDAYILDLKKKWRKKNRKPK